MGFLLPHVRHTLSQDLVASDPYREDGLSRLVHLERYLALGTSSLELLVTDQASPSATSVSKVHVVDASIDAFASLCFSMLSTSNQLPLRNSQFLCHVGLLERD